MPPAPPPGPERVWGGQEGTATPPSRHLLSPQTDVFIAMELMGTCAEKLKKRMQGPIPERILGKMTVAVSGWVGRGRAGGPPPGPVPAITGALLCPRHRS